MICYKCPTQSSGPMVEVVHNSLGPSYFSHPDDLRQNFQHRGLCTSIQRERCQAFFVHCYKKSLFHSEECMVTGWCNMRKQYWTVPPLTLMCFAGPTSTQRLRGDIPTFCSLNETTVIQQLPAFGYRGCYADNHNARLLSINSNGPSNLSVMTCTSICWSQGYAFSGVEYSIQCWCDNALNPRAIPTDQSNCNYACCADSSVACGGPDFIMVYEASYSLTQIANATTCSGPSATQTATTTNNGGPSSTQTATATNNNGPSPTQTATATNKSGLSSIQSPNITDNSGNHPNSATSDDSNTSSNKISDGSSNSQTSNNITLGTSIGIGVPGLILSALLVKWKFSKRSRNPRQGTSQTSPKASSTHSRYTESISTI